MPNLPRASLPRVAALGKDLICRGPVFAEGRSLPMAPVAGPRQRVSLPSARDLALGKARVSSSDDHITHDQGKQ